MSAGVYEFEIITWWGCGGCCSRVAPDLNLRLTGAQQAVNAGCEVSLPDAVLVAAARCENDLRLEHVCAADCDMVGSENGRWRIGGRICYSQEALIDVRANCIHIAFIAGQGQLMSGHTAGRASAQGGRKGCLAVDIVLSL